MEHVEATLAEFAVEPDRLELEVTESAAISDESIAFLRELRHLGVRVAIDDFGTGFSSLGSLQRMPVDLLKVDRTFSAALSKTVSRGGEVALAIMRSAVEIADALGIKCLAEGIEEPGQLSTVRALGFDFVQGFHVATPAPTVSRHLTVVEPSTEPTWPVTRRGRRRPPTP
jgi:EAL domain-containing protein (putative c-di-GMP-specific phosphodiesterase class I)